MLIPPMTHAANTWKIMFWPWAALTEPKCPVISMPANAASRPPTVSTIHATRSVRIPAARAASTLPPTAYSDLPERKYPRSTMPTTNSSPHSHTDTGTVSHDVDPRYRNDSGTVDRLWPPVIPVCRPRITISMPSVTMKPESRNFMISKPLNAPISTPTARHTGIGTVRSAAVAR